MSPLPAFVPPQLSRSVEQPPAGPQWLHKIKLDGFRMAARIDNGSAQLLPRTGLDWTDKYSGLIKALANGRRGPLTATANSAGSTRPACRALGKRGAALLLKRLSGAAFAETDLLFEVTLQPGESD